MTKNKKLKIKTPKKLEHKKLDIKKVSFSVEKRDTYYSDLFDNEVLRVFIHVGKKKAELFHLNEEGIFGFDLGWNVHDLHAVGIPTEDSGYGQQIPIITGPRITEKGLHEKLDELLTFADNFKGAFNDR
jgi:hypothetical protein